LESIAAAQQLSLDVALSKIRQNRKRNSFADGALQTHTACLRLYICSYKQNARNQREDVTTPQPEPYSRHQVKSS